MKAGALGGIAAIAAAAMFVALLASAPAEGAKKRCKPKVAYVAGKKKKRCKKVPKNPPIALPVDLPIPPTPSVATTRERARATWSAANKDIDLYVWDQAGRKTFYGSDEIPGGSHTGDTQTAGFEAFADEQWFEPVPSGGNRILTYGMCLNDTGPVSATISVLQASGSPYSATVPLNQTAGQLVLPAGGYVPPDENAWC